MKSLKRYISILRTVKNRPTKFGLYLVLIIIALFLQAYMHNYNIVYIMMFMLVGLAIASSFYGILNLYSVKVKLLSNDRFFANEQASYRLSIKNNSENSVYDINLKSDDKLQNIKSIKAGEDVILKVDEKFQKRGATTLKDMELNSLFPLSYESKYKPVKLEQTLFVYAQPKGISLFKSLYKSSALHGEIDEFEGIKNFIEGENISSIHWASLAKHDQLKSKNFLYENESKTLHFSFKNIKGDEESKLSQLTLWVLESERYTLDFTLELADKIMSSKEETIDEILESIARY